MLFAFNFFFSVLPYYFMFFGALHTLAWYILSLHFEMKILLYAFLCVCALSEITRELNFFFASGLLYLNVRMLYERA